MEDNSTKEATHEFSSFSVKVDKDNKVRFAGGNDYTIEEYTLKFKLPNMIFLENSRKVLGLILHCIGFVC